KSIYKTGGGKADCTIQSTPGQDKILGFIGDRMEPLENNFDSDTDYLELTKHSRNKEETFTKSVDDNVDIVELGIEQAYDSCHSSDQHNFSINNEKKTAIVDTEEHSIPVIPGYLNLYSDKTKQTSTKKKMKFNDQARDQITASKSTGSHVYKNLNELIGKRSLMVDNNVENKKKIYDLQVAKAKVELETAIIEKEVAENKKLSSISEVQQNRYQEEILKLELELKKKLLQK
ncbi:myb/SANT-like DNA-binding domain-containing protein 3, partial [Aphis craccivora]